MSRLRVGVVGAGRRVHEMYAPVLGALRDDFEVVGVASQTPAAARRAAATLGGAPHQDLAVLAREARPDLLVVAVAAVANAAVAVRAIQTGCAALLETPLAVGAADAARVCVAAARSRAPVAVAEQKPFLPAECFKRQLIDAGALGQVVVVENDYRSYDYHAIAQLRRYLAHDALPVTARAVRASFALDPYERREDEGGAAPGPRVEQWELGTVTFDDGGLLVHRFTSAYKVAPFRTFQSLRIYGTRGSAVNDEIVVLDERGRSVRLPVEANAAGVGRAPRSITATLPAARMVQWQNPFADSGFTDDQVGVALHLAALRAAILAGGRPLYGAHDALRDVEVVEALRRSAEADGAPVPVAHRCEDPRCARPPPVEEVGVRGAGACGAPAIPRERPAPAPSHLLTRRECDDHRACDGVAPFRPTATYPVVKLARRDERRTGPSRSRAMRSAASGTMPAAASQRTGREPMCAAAWRVWFASVAKNRPCADTASTRRPTPSRSSRTRVSVNR